MTLKDFHDSVWLPYQAGRLRAVTLAGYDSKWRLHVEPTLGHMELGALSTEAIERWIASMASPGIARHSYALLRSMLRKAERWGYIEVDPTRRIELGRAPVRLKARVLDAREINELLRGFFGHPLEAWLLVSVCLGLRREEACGLEWRDIDLRSGRVRVERVLQSVGGRLVVERPKTELSRREVWLPRFATLRLRAIKGAAKPTQRLVCDLSPDAVARRYKAHCRREGLPWVPPKDLRHSWATSALAAGVDVAVVSRALGHEDISTTARYYLRPDSRVLRDAQALWARAIVG